MARPVDWLPLGDSDPVPGDPQRISEQAAHLASTAQEISGQVARLRAIAAGQLAEQGLHADKLRSASSDVAGGLEKVVGRYQKTSAALSAWVPELEYAQSQSLKALAQAQDAASRQRASQPVTRPAGYQETPQDQQDDQTRATALNQASSDLAAARQMLLNATSYRDQKGSETRHKIENAINDGVSDYWWDKFKGFISKYAWLIGDVCTGLEILATALALVCLFIPGLNFIDALLWVAFGMTALATIGRGVLAATGSGSWLDFGLDVLALFTFGASKILSGALKAGAEGAVQEGKGLLAAQWVEKYFGANRMGTKVVDMVEGWVMEALPDSSRLGRFAQMVAAGKVGGGLEDWENFSKIATIFGKLDDVTQGIARAMNAAKATVLGLRISTGLSLGDSLASLIGGGAPISVNGGVWRLPLGDIPGIGPWLKAVISDNWDKLESATTKGLTAEQVNFLLKLLHFTPLDPAASAFHWSVGGGW
jgi:type VII secretion system ESX-1 substrate